MWLFVSILFGLGSSFFIILIFGLMRAGRRADEWEEKILKIISPISRGKITEAIADAQTLRTPLTVPEPRVFVEK